MASPDTQVRDNRAVNNIVGINVQGSAYVEGNVARGNFTGITVFGDGAGPNPTPKPTLTGNVAVTNYTGFQFTDAEPETFTRNSAIGNITDGIAIEGGVMPAFRKVNVFGSGVCGIDSDVLVDASDVYWGASTGPGADPADVACGTVDTTVWRPTDVSVPVTALK
jgi:hypothetical protein